MTLDQLNTSSRSLDMHSCNPVNTTPGKTANKYTQHESIQVKLSNKTVDKNNQLSFFLNFRPNIIVNCDVISVTVPEADLYALQHDKPVAFPCGSGPSVGFWWNHL